ncbi:MAG TPA: sigma-70 family RNA polymerase sigma factor [Thermoanaerobaculia bacterium]|nr:sigma-70 family RNA polymerase sigma factor [Thermoanaerobaculia bacterium]
MPAAAMTFMPPAETESERIARGLRERDIELLGGLVEQYQVRLVRYLIHLLGRREQVEDLVQEIWLRVLERGWQYDSRLRFEPWLFAIARHLAVDLLRRRDSRSLATAPGGGGDALLARRPSPGYPSPFEAAARTEDAARLASCLGALGPLYREALLLRFQEEMSLQEIARVVEAPVSTVSSRIYRGLAALRAELERNENAHRRS